MWFSITWNFMQYYSDLDRTSEILLSKDSLYIALKGEVWGFIAWCTDSMELNTLRPRQNGRHFADNIFRCIFLNVNVWILIIISLKCVPNGPINITPALVRCGMAFIEPIHHNNPNTVLLTYSSIGSGNGLVPSRRQAMIWTNDG